MKKTAFRKKGCFFHILSGKIVSVSVGEGGVYMEQNRMIEILMQEALEIIIMFDCDGSVIKYNKAAGEELGYGERLHGINIAEVLRKEFESESDVAKVMEYLKSRKETAVYRSNGTCFSAKIHIEYDSEADRYFLFALDMEVNREMANEVSRIKAVASQAMEVKNEFVANITHELRTPVNGIRGHVENLKDTYLTTEQRRTLHIIEHCCSNMSSIINNILDFSKLQSGKFELENRKFDLREMMENIVSANLATVNEKGLKLTLNVEESVPQVLIGDELRLTQILNNLLSNAVKFTSAGFIRIEVAVTLRFSDEIELFFMVVDSGIGISKEEQDRLFQSFSQVDTSITRRYGGTGLGLTITKELVELMNGKIYLQSEKGRGSNFSFSIRLHTVEVTDDRAEYKKEVKQFLGQYSEEVHYKQVEEYYRFGSEENKNELAGRMEKLVLCIELGSWEKAEFWAGELSKLLKRASTDVKRAALKLEMAVRKEDYDKSMMLHEDLKRLLLEKTGEMDYGF